MKRHILSLFLIAVSAMMSFSCNDEPVIKTDTENKLVIAMSMPDNIIQTRSETLSAYSDPNNDYTEHRNQNNCNTAALYAQSDGHLVASDTGNKQIVFNLPSEAVYIYTIANMPSGTSVNWPNNLSNIGSVSVKIDMQGIMAGANVGNIKEWHTSDGPITVNCGCIPLFAELRVKKSEDWEESGLIELNLTSAYISKTGQYINPWGSNQDNKSSNNNCDDNNVTDLTIFDGGDFFSLYVPAKNACELTLFTTAHSEGSTITQKYVANIPAINIQENSTYELMPQGLHDGTTGDDDVIYTKLTSVDTRSLKFTNDTVTLWRKGDYQYEEPVRGWASNGDTNWSYNLTVAKNTTLGSYITLTHDNETTVKDLTKPINFTYDPSSEKKLYINNNYEGATRQIFRVIAKMNNNDTDETINADTLTVIVPSRYETRYAESIEIVVTTADWNDAENVWEQNWDNIDGNIGFYHRNASVRIKYEIHVHFNDGYEEIIKNPNEWDDEHGYGHIYRVDGGGASWYNETVYEGYSPSMPGVYNHEADGTYRYFMDLIAGEGYDDGTFVLYYRSGVYKDEHNNPLEATATIKCPEYPLLPYTGF